MSQNSLSVENWLIAVKKPHKRFKLTKGYALLKVGLNIVIVHTCYFLLSYLFCLYDKSWAQRKSFGQIKPLVRFIHLIKYMNLQVIPQITGISVTGNSNSF